MTLEEIERSQVNLDIAREAFDQASKRLADMLDTKKAFEQKFHAHRIDGSDA